MEKDVGAQAQLEGMGVGPPRRGQGPGQWSYLRVVGVGIVVSPGSVQREKHNWAQGPSTGLGPGQRPASREELGAFQTGEGAGQAQLFGTRTQVPSKTFPGPATRVQRAGGSRALSHSHTHTQREMCISTHIEAYTLRWIHTHCTHIETHRHYMHSRMQTWTHMHSHTF